jgi:hypothetical protein
MENQVSKVQGIPVPSRATRYAVLYTLRPGESVVITDWERGSLRATISHIQATRRWRMTMRSLPDKTARVWRLDDGSEERKQGALSALELVKEFYHDPRVVAMCGQSNTAPDLGDLIGWLRARAGVKRVDKPGDFRLSEPRREEEQA